MIAPPKLLVSPPCGGPSHQRGMALVIILAIVVLVFVMAVAFLSSVSTERTAAANYASSITTRQLGDMAVNLVQAQIHHAATQESGGTPIAWASQPGMVRTFAQDGSLRLAYKLYSDREMTGQNVDPVVVAQDLAGWRTDTAHFTDLNAPVGVDRDDDGIIAPSELVYPIVNPAGISAAGGKSPLIDGFSITSAPGASPDQPAPMPVRWLYVLQDGTLAPTTGSGNTATIVGATATNPIIGRIAFWTDDETSKLNINTAAHGSPWDIPRVMAEDEILTFAKNQPTIYEFQRFPGHPAMTSLAPVLGHLFGVSPLNADPYQNLTGLPEQNFSDFIYSIIPRIESGGSQFGSKVATQPIILDEDRLYASLDELIFDPSRKAHLQDAVTIDRNTLEAAKFFLTAHSRAPELTLSQGPRISMWPINNGQNDKQPSSMDQLIAFCSTINAVPYYLQRSDPDDPVADINLQQNQDLKNYLRGIFALPIPGFGTSTFNTKYGVPESDQIVTQMLDYIRASNIMSVPDYGATKFSTDVTGRDHEESDAIGTRGGQVSPIRDGETKGFGRIPTISRAVLHFYVSDVLDTVNAGTSLVTKRPLPSSGGDATAYLPSLANTPEVALPGGGAPNSDYDLETKALLYFDLFDPMAGYPVSNYNFDLIVEFQGPWSVTPAGIPPATPSPQFLGFDAIHGGSVRIPMRYDGYHGYDFKLPTPVATPRARGANIAYRLGGGRSVLSSLRGFLGFDRNFRDNVNNITGNMGGDGLTDFYPLVSNGMRLHRTLKTIPVSPPTSPPKGKFVDTPKLAPTPATAGAMEFGDTFTFNGGTAIVKLVVNSTGGTNPGNDRLIQTFRFDFPAFVKTVPSYAPEASAAGQRKQMTTDMNFGYRITGFPQTTVLTGSTVPTASVYLTQPGDVIVSLEAAYGDFRLIAGKSNLTTDPTYSGGTAGGDFVPHEDYFRNIAVTDIRSRHAYSFRISWPNYYGGIYGPTAPTGYKHPEFGRFLPVLIYGRNAQPDLPSRWRSGVPVFSASGGTGNFLPDYDTSFTYMQDGPYVGRADEGSVIDTAGTGNWPWQAAQVVEKGPSESFYSPNKQMTGAGNFGSLPTGVVRGRPWQTLLFRPDPDKQHPGSQNPPDYLLMDLFWMPIVEPYAISEPLSTAGKINLNHRIYPFSYINRDTALRGLLLKEEIRSVSNSTLGSPPANDGSSYKTASAIGAGVAATLNSRTRINLDATVQAINARFAGGNAYISETEMATVPLIPVGQNYTANFAYESSWWKSRTATGDNMRERPYVNLIPRLTTRSNTYTVHYRVQALGRPAIPNQWREGRDPVVGEYRGSSTIERFINPNLADPTWTSAATTPNLNRFYIWRTLSNKQFAP